MEMRISPTSAVENITYKGKGGRFLKSEFNL